MLSDPKKERTHVDAGAGRKSIAQTFIKKQNKTKQKRLKLNEVKHPAKEVGKEPQSKPKETRRKET